MGSSNDRAKGLDTFSKSPAASQSLVFLGGQSSEHSNIAKEGDGQDGYGKERRNWPHTNELLFGSSCRVLQMWMV